MDNPRKNIYFASDFHLGLDAKLSSQDREKIIVEWLDSRGIAISCNTIMFVTLPPLFVYSKLIYSYN